MVCIEIIRLEGEATEYRGDCVGLAIGQRYLLGGRHVSGDFHYID